MVRRTADERARVANPEAAAAELAQHYARILGQQPSPQVSDVIRTCLRRLPSRLPIQGADLRAVEELIERVLRLGEVGVGDPIGSPQQIDDYIARCLGESARGSRPVYRALRAMLGHTVLVERLSRQVWVLRLIGLTDPSSKLHMALLAETPALYSLPASKPSAPLGTEPSRTQLHEELIAERQARVEADKQRVAATVELGELRRALDEERQARGVADERATAAASQVAALERDLATLRRAHDKERQARGAADERATTAAAQLAALERDLAPLRRALDEERRARGAADLLCQATAAQVTALEEELGSSREATRNAQAADAASVWRLIEADQPQAVMAFLVARMHGLNVEDAIETLRRLRQPAAALRVAAREQAVDPRSGDAPEVPKEAEPATPPKADHAPPQPTEPLRTRPRPQIPASNPLSANRTTRSFQVMVLRHGTPW